MSFEETLTWLGLTVNDCPQLGEMAQNMVFCVFFYLFLGRNESQNMFEDILNYHLVQSAHIWSHL